MGAEQSLPPPLSLGHSLAGFSSELAYLGEISDPALPSVKLVFYSWELGVWFT